MSAGLMSRSRYQLSDENGGGIHPIRVNLETIGAFNPTPGAAVNGRGSVKVSGGKRQFGITARSITIAWNAAPPAGYKAGGLIRLPILTPAAFALLTPGSTFEYLGTTAIVVGRTAESVR